MKIYTKGGDRGETGLYGGRRVSKDDRRIAAYGTLDELNAVIGLALADQAFPGPLRAPLLRVQGELFQLGTELATPSGASLPIEPLGEAQITQLEREIDQMEAELEPLKQFILPGGSLGSAHLHLARVTCRRGERELVALNRSETLRESVLQYVNRLSDWLFVCARFANHLAGASDIPWIAPKKATRS